jgi:beta-lactam-binding protein with PASTA domain
VVGRTLGGRYIVETRVGGGGMATVYRGVDTFLRRQVALKVLRGQFAGDAEFVSRFRREARAAAMLSHPGIVAVYDVGQEGDDCYYIVQEFIDGHTLKERIESDGALPVAEALDVSRQVLRALGHAHGAGVIHRDVKPQNVLLTRDGRVKVTDFGIARAEAGATMVHSGAIVGTAHYAAPEQIRGNPVDERCDVYSTGVMLYEMLAGKPPFDAEGPLAVALQHVERPVPDPAETRPDLPPGLSPIVRRAMAKSPDDRYRNTAEFDADLEAVQAGRLPVHARAAARVPVGVGAAAAAAWPPAAAALVLGLAAVGTGGAVLAMRWLAVPTVKVPGVQGDDLGTAQRAMGAAGLAYVVDQRYDPTVPIEMVIGTVPTAGSLVKRDRQIQIWQSLGPPPVTLPALAGLQQQAALTELTQMGLQPQVDPTPQFSPTVPAGSVLSSVPAAGTQVPSGSAVTLTLSAGPQASGSMPDYVGEMADTVEADISQRQWTLGQTAQQKSGWPVGTVIATDPVAGQPVLPGTSIALTISSGCLYQQTLALRAGTPAIPAAAPEPAPVPAGGGGVAFGTPGFSTTAAGSASKSSGGAPSASSTSTSSSSAPKASTAAAASSASGAAPAGMLEVVTLTDGPTGTPRTEFNQVVPPGQAFDVQLCWASPQGAQYAWVENGVTQSVGSVGGGAAAAAAGTGASGSGTAGAAVPNG